MTARKLPNDLVQRQLVDPLFTPSTACRNVVPPAATSVTRSSRPEGMRASLSCQQLSPR